MSLRGIASRVRELEHRLDAPSQSEIRAAVERAYCGETLNDLRPDVAEMATRLAACIAAAEVSMVGTPDADLSRPRDPEDDDESICTESQPSTSIPSASNPTVTQ